MQNLLCSVAGGLLTWLLDLWPQSHWTGMMQTAISIIEYLIFCVFVFVYFAFTAWAIRDAQHRGWNDRWSLVVFFLLGPLATLPWLAIRPETRLSKRLPSEYSNPDDAMSAAAKLDQLGEWDLAIDLYQYSLKRWPHLQEYATENIKQINEKRSLG